MADKVQEIIEEIKIIFEQTPSELSADIKRRGIYISVWGALLRGIDQKMKQALNLDVTIIDH